MARLRDLELVEQVPRGPATYYVPGERLGLPITEEDDDLFSGLPRESDGLSRRSGGLSHKSEPLSHKSEPLSHKSEGLSHKSEADVALDEERAQLLAELPDDIRAAVEGLGQRSRDPKQLSELILSICALRPYGTRELAVLLRRRRNYLHRRHIVLLLEQGGLQYRYPNEPNRPDQAYIAAEDRS